MNHKYIGSGFSNTLKEWKKDPEFLKHYEERKEKYELALQLKKIREQEGLSQRELAEISSIPQSVIARIESLNSKTLPRLDLIGKIVGSMGYSAHIVFDKISSNANKRRQFAHNY